MGKKLLLDDLILVQDTGGGKQKGDFVSVKQLKTAVSHLI